MKKFIIAFAAVLTLVSASAFTAPKHGTNPAEATFQNVFKGALDVRWIQGQDIITASFVLGNTRAVAYFDYSGELLGTERNIMFSQLPLVVVTEINQRYGSAAVYNIIEYTAGSDTFYKMTADLPKKQLRLRASSTGDISVEKKIKK